MAAVEKAHPLAGFTKLSEQVYVRPADVTRGSTGASSDLKDPTTIVIYCWGDAQPKHVVKFVSGYLALYPGARIVVVLGPMLKMLTETLRQRSESMEPVLQAILDSSTSGGRSSHEDERVLAHVMSNTGGANFAATLHAHKRKTQEKGASTGKAAQQGQGGRGHGDEGDDGTTPFPHVLTVVDSTPGSTSVRGNLGPWSRAMTIGAGVTGPVLGRVGQGLAAVFLLLAHGLMWLAGHEGPAVASSRATNDATLSPLTAHRIYMYSPSDEIIQSWAVEEHAAEARARGYQVELQRFEGSPHVGHMRAHPERYWGAIKEAWDRAAYL